MDAWHLTHFGVLCAWAGVLVVEFVLESLGEDEVSQAQATRLHFWIDLFVEFPLVLAVLTTGGVMLARVWPPTTLHLIKVGCALAAIGLNLYCSIIVILRYRVRTDPAAVGGYRRRVRLSAFGVPFGLAAAYIGLAYFT